MKLRELLDEEASARLMEMLGENKETRIRTTPNLSKATLIVAVEAEIPFPLANGEDFMNLSNKLSRKELLERLISSVNSN